jgi:hypothetical protein
MEAKVVRGTQVLARTEIPEGQRIRVRLEQLLSSATADEGQPVQLAVTEDVKINDTVVFTQGASVTGTVVKAVPKRRMGRTGKLDFSIDRATAADGASVPIRYTMQKKEGGSHAVATGVVTAGVAVLFWPAAPFVLLMKGKDTVINKGMIFEVFTDSPHVLIPKREIAVAQDEKSTAVSITSDTGAGDIEVDGIFVGTCPSTLQLSPGDHKIRVANGTKTWERTIRINGGSTLMLATTPKDLGEKVAQ